jgi:serine/threonine protein kinase/tetratricopeptide (TPR) repeat protein
MDHTPRSRVRGLYEWLTGSTPSSLPSDATPVPGPASAESLPARIGHYTVVRKVGQGGMGVVYAARDERLERTVALKTLPPIADDDTARQRLWREARAAASVSHPNICQIYDIAEDRGQLFIAMELLDGETLAERLLRGAMQVSDAVPVGLEMLAALSALHTRGIVHRDLKPSNVFMTSHGVKLLDFGLARPELDSSATGIALTRTGMVVGTPRYMAPEQVTGDTVDASSDLFAFGAILFEMLAGRPAFDGRTVVEILHATAHEQPPALTGSPEVAAVDRVIRRLLAKRPADRPPNAEAVAAELREINPTDRSGVPVLARTLTRLIVLPFRVLRPDAETDFLAFSLPDAIATSLSGLTSAIVRSSVTAARFAGEAPDLRVLAAEADVDRVVTGTLLRSADQLRASVQLVEAPSGTLLASHTVQASLGDLFSLQDDITRRVVDALALPLGGQTPTTAADSPQSGGAYELYLRANELARTYEGLPRARDLYERCLLLDPKFAPAWAHLGRCHRVIGKYVDTSPGSETRAEEAFGRALQLNPRLTVAHKFYANLEADTGRAQRGMERLLDEATRHGNDPELFSGLVHACRYCGLLEASIAAHVEARRLDPNVPTSFEQTLLMTGDIDRLLDTQRPALIAGADDGIRVIGLGLAGRRDEARRALLEMQQRAKVPLFRAWTDYLIGWIDRRTADMLARPLRFADFKIQEDPEAIFQEGWLLCDVGEHQRGLERLQRALAKGYFMSFTLAHSRQFDPLRGDPAFETLCAEAEAGRQQALAAFLEHGGERLLGAAA